MIKLTPCALLAACAVTGPTLLPGKHPTRQRVQTVRCLDWADSCEAAVGFWNAELDRTALVLAEPGAEPDVLVTTAPAPRGSRALGWADPTTKLVQVSSSVIDSYTAYLVIAHEIGHAAFNLAHDPEQPCSVMYPRIDPEPWKDFRCLIVEPEDVDATHQ